MDSEVFNMVIPALAIASVFISAWAVNKWYVPKIRRLMQIALGVFALIEMLFAVVLFIGVHLIPAIAFGVSALVGFVCIYLIRDKSNQQRKLF